MNPAMLAATLRLPWQLRRGRAWHWVWLAILVALPLVVAWRVSLTPAQTLGVALVAVAAWWWWVQVDSLLAQNHPNHARLVPGQRRTLRTALLAHAALAGVLAWLGGATVAGPGLEWALWVLVGLPVLAWTQRQPWIWLPLSLMSLLPFAWRAAAVRFAEAPALLWLPAVAVALVSLLALLGTGSASHRRVHARLQRWRADARRNGEGRSLAVTARRPWLRTLVTPFTWPDRWWRRQVLTRPTSANAVQRLDLALQPQAGAPMVAWMIVLVFGGAYAALMAGQVLRPDLAWARLVDGGRLGLCMGLFGVVAGMPIGRLSLLWARRREQPLLALLPGTPAGAALAAALERHWRREAVFLWLLSASLVLAIAMQGSPRSLHFVGGFLAAALPLGVWVETRWRTMRGKALTARPSIVLFGGSLAAAMAAQHFSIPPWVCLPAGVLLHVAAVQLRGAPGTAVLPLGRAAL